MSSTELTYRVFFSEEDEGWIARCSGIDWFSLLSAFGDTPVEALGELATVVELAEEALAARPQSKER